MRNTFYRLFLIAILAAGLLPAFADTLSFTGNLRSDANFTSCGAGCTLGAGNSDGDYAQWAAVAVAFPVTTLSTMEAITFSYGGGINGQGKTIAQGGFEPYLSLFDAAGDFLASTFAGVTCPPGAHTNTVSGQCFDELLNGRTLGPGSYRIAISAFENMSFAENSGTGTLSDGFTGLGNLNPGEDLYYAFDVILTPTRAVPEPGYVLLVTAALAGLGFKRWMKGKRS